MPLKPLVYIQIARVFGGLARSGSVHPVLGHTRSPGVNFDPFPGHYPASYALKTISFDHISTYLNLPGKTRPSTPAFRPYWGNISPYSSSPSPRPGRAPPLKIHSSLAKWGVNPSCQVGMDFCGGRGRGSAGAAGIWGYIPPKWPENGGRGSGLPGKVKIGTDRIKTNSFKGIRGRIVTRKRVEIDPWRPLDRGVYTLLYSTPLYSTLLYSYVTHHPNQ